MKQLTMNNFMKLLACMPEDAAVYTESGQLTGLWIAKPDSYTGYFDTVGCEADDDAVYTVKDLKQQLAESVEQEIDNSFRVKSNTPVWISNYNESKDALVWLRETTRGVKLFTEELYS